MDKRTQQRLTDLAVSLQSPSSRQPVPGPVTAGMRILRKREPRPVAWTLRLWPALPALSLVLPVLHRSPHLDLYAGNVLGLDATLCLAGCITVTPLMTVTRARAARLRWWYGIWMFTLGAAGLVITVLVNSDPESAAAGNLMRWTGLAVVVLLAPMTATSNAAAQKLLGPEWKRWQRWLVWAVWGLVAVHLAAMQAWPALSAFAAATVPLIILRLARGPVRAWRAGGYSTGGWWLGLAVLGSVWLAGLVILLTEQGLACASAITGS